MFKDNTELTKAVNNTILEIGNNNTSPFLTLFFPANLWHWVNEACGRLSGNKVNLKVLSAAFKYFEQLG